MPVTGKIETVQEEGVIREAFTVSFTNGAKDQLEELKNFFKANDYLETVKLGISFLQRMKELNEKKALEKEDVGK